MIPPKLTKPIDPHCSASASDTAEVGWAYWASFAAKGCDVAHREPANWHGSVTPISSAGAHHFSATLHWRGSWRGRHEPPAGGRRRLLLRRRDGLRRLESGKCAIGLSTGAARTSRTGDGVWCGVSSSAPRHRHRRRIGRFARHATGYPVAEIAEGRRWSTIFRPGSPTGSTIADRSAISRPAGRTRRGTPRKPNLDGSRSAPALVALPAASQSGVALGRCGQTSAISRPTVSTMRRAAAPAIATLSCITTVPFGDRPAPPGSCRPVEDVQRARWPRRVQRASSGFAPGASAARRASTSSSAPRGARAPRHALPLAGFTAGLQVIGGRRRCTDRTTGRRHLHQVSAGLGR